MTGEGRHPDRVPLREFAIQLPPAAYGGPVRRLDPPVTVRVWIPRSRQGWTQLDGEADAWTDVAAHVTYSDEHGRVGTVWVWAGAVTRIDGSTPPPVGHLRVEHDRANSAAS